MIDQIQLELDTAARYEAAQAHNAAHSNSNNSSSANRRRRTASSTSSTSSGHESDATTDTHYSVHTGLHSGSHHSNHHHMSSSAHNRSSSSMLSASGGAATASTATAVNTTVAAASTAAASAAAAAALYTSTLTQLEVTDGVQRQNTGGLHSRLQASPTVKSALTEAGVDYKGVRTQVAHGIEQVGLTQLWFTVAVLRCAIRKQSLVLVVPPVFRVVAVCHQCIVSV